MKKYLVIISISLGLFLSGFYSSVFAKELITNDLGMTFVPIPSGEFIMGTSDLDDVIFELPDGDVSQVKDETPAHKVVISQPFYLLRTEVTQQQWFALMGDKPGPLSHWQQKNWQQLPVVSINWYRVQEFIDTLNNQSEKYHYRLPSEAEWEYSARAGSTGIRPFAREDLDAHGWHIENSKDQVQPVATLAANAWGLYDMLGNAWEWVDDYYAEDSYQQHVSRDPKGVKNGTLKVRRGGSYHCKPYLLRPSYRAADTPKTAYSVLGFRLILEAK